ncbi:hypothetical protein F5876DRAFT_90040 [Lentinula aff. lateritia]|uniref:Uncharacterized protein n=1 Tax=Lentinula aff. lateritia TaxID=2804960 RepID=A0ACC1TUE1_9AGAR|nr:hypothetical protein F5876DRAFT_90040 [Lentinula aff. lateritia]
MAVNLIQSSNDALQKHGIIPAREPTSPSPSHPPSPTCSDLLNNFTPSELREINKDAPDDETEQMIATYRRQRIADEKTLDKRSRFGRVYPIGRDDYTWEVTQASKINEEGDEKEEGTAVIYFLYKDGQYSEKRSRFSRHEDYCCSQYPHSKFVSLDSSIPIDSYQKKMCKFYFGEW